MARRRAQETKVSCPASTRRAPVHLENDDRSPPLRARDVYARADCGSPAQGARTQVAQAKASRMGSRAKQLVQP
jgi:hypothetical protein